MEAYRRYRKFILQVLQRFKVMMEFGRRRNDQQASFKAADGSEADSSGRDGGNNNNSKIIHVESVANTSTLITISALDPL